MTAPVIAKLDEVDIAAAIDANVAYNNAVSKITSRMDHIVQRCIEIAGGKLDWWDWLGDGDWDDQASGDFIHSYQKDCLSIRAEWDTKKEIIFIDKDGNECGIEEGFPTRWLYEDFEEEFSKGLKNYKEKEKQRAANTKENKKKNKEKKKALVDTIAAKFTKEERKLLGL